MTQFEQLPRKRVWINTTADGYKESGAIVHIHTERVLELCVEYEGVCVTQCATGDDVHVAAALTGYRYSNSAVEKVCGKCVRPTKSVCCVRQPISSCVTARVGRHCRQLVAFSLSSRPPSSAQRRVCCTYTQQHPPHRSTHVNSATLPATHER